MATNAALRASVDALAAVIADRQGRVEKAVDALAVVIRGNGQEGLVSKVATVEQLTKELKRAEEQLRTDITRLHGENVARLTKLEVAAAREGKLWGFRGTIVKAVLYAIAVIGAATVSGLLRQHLVP